MQEKQLIRPWLAVFERASCYCRAGLGHFIPDSVTQVVKPVSQQQAGFSNKELAFETYVEIGLGTIP